MERPERTSLPPNQFALATASGKEMLRRSGVLLAVGALLVTFCYFFVDRPVAFFVHEQHVARLLFLEWLTHIPMVFAALAPIIVVCAVVRLAWGPLSRWERTLLASAVSLMVAVSFEYYVKFLFGRYWPETWVEDNPSLIGSGAYGFHPLHFGAAYGSFPSGHTARAVAVLSAYWAAWPRWRIVWTFVGLSVVVGLVGMNYHFVGDTIGGTVLGALVGMYTSWFFREATRTGT